MKEEPDSLSVPYNFARCFNAQCPQAPKCLRHIATQLDTADNLYITIINPARYPADGNQCECFKTAVKVHVAWGLKQLLNRIPYEDAVSIRIQMVGHYGKTGYYRFYRGERGLMPKDQAYIRQLFRNKGIKEEPTYQLNSSYKCDTYLFHRGQLFRHRIIFRNFLLTQTFSYIFQNTYARNKVFQLFLRDTEIFVIASFNVRTA